ncbi:MAG: hypothetical protein HYY30_12250 [Chloroflexi bacterium]|nr:hypothetical protein [Chloroflexota bacterium]
MFVVSESWKAAYSGAVVGVLVMRHVANPDHHPALNSLKDELEAELRSRFADSDAAAVAALETIKAYEAYYKRFKKTYHVRLQLESVAFKGKSIPRVAALVEAMFMAELKNQLLTAGHDLDALQTSVRVDIANGGERYVLLNGQEQALKPDDMMMADGLGVISSVIYGPDGRTRITANTRNALFAVYAPPGIDEQTVRHHLEDIQANVLVVAPKAETTLLKVFCAG